MKRKNNVPSLKNKKSKEIDESKDHFQQLESFMEQIQKFLEKTESINPKCVPTATKLYQSIQESLQNIKSKKFRVGIIGQQGSGKSTLFNILCSVKPNLPLPADDGVHSVTDYITESSYQANRVTFSYVLVGVEERKKRFDDRKSQGNFIIDFKAVEELYQKNSIILEQDVNNEEELFEEFKNINEYLVKLKNQKPEILLCFERFHISAPVRFNSKFIIYDTPGIDHQNQAFSKESIHSIMKSYMDSFDILICPFKERQPTEMFMTYLLKNYNIYEKLQNIVFALNIKDLENLNDLSTLNIQEKLSRQFPNIYKEFITSLYSPGLLQKIDYFEKNEQSKSLLQNILTYPLNFFKESKMNELFQFLEKKVLNTEFLKVNGKISSFLALMLESTKKIKNGQKSRIGNVVTKSLELVKNQPFLKEKFKVLIEQFLFCGLELEKMVSLTKEELKSELFIYEFFKIFTKNMKEKMFNAIVSNIDKIENTNHQNFKIIETSEYNQQQLNYDKILTSFDFEPLNDLKKVYETISSKFKNIDKIIDDNIIMNEIIEISNMEEEDNDVSPLILHITKISRNITEKVYPIFKEAFEDWEIKIKENIIESLQNIKNERKKDEDIQLEISKVTENFNKFTKMSSENLYFDLPKLMKTTKDAYFYETDKVQGEIIEHLHSKKKDFKYQKKDNLILNHEIKTIDDHQIYIVEKEDWYLEMNQKTFDYLEEYSKSYEKWYNNIEKKKDDILVPLFIPTIIADTRDFSKYKIIEDNLDKMKHIKLLLIEPSQKDLYIEKYGLNDNIYFIILPENNIHPRFTLNMINMISKKFKFPMIMTASQSLEKCKEFYFSILESKSCSFARAFLWCQKVLASIQRKIQLELIEKIHSNYSLIKNHLLDETLNGTIKREEYKYFTDELLDKNMNTMRFDDLCELVLDLPKSLSLKEELVKIINKQALGAVDLVLSRFMKIQSVKCYPKIFNITQSKSERSNFEAFSLNLITSQKNYYFGKFGRIETIERKSISGWENLIKKERKKYQKKLKCETLMFINFGFNKK